MKRFRRLRRLPGVLFLLGVGLIIGLFVGSFVNAHPSRTDRVVVRMDGTGERGDLVFREERFVPPEINVVVPEMPELPEMPRRPLSPVRQIEIVHAPPTLFQVFRSVSNVLASLTLIGLGIGLLVKQRRQPVAKAPE